MEALTCLIRGYGIGGLHQEFQSGPSCSRSDDALGKVYTKLHLMTDACSATELVAQRNPGVKRGPLSYNYRFLFVFLQCVFSHPFFLLEWCRHATQHGALSCTFYEFEIEKVLMIMTMTLFVQVVRTT